jgi:hypothetical protein
MCLFQAVNRNDEEQMKRFRVIVKRRLYEPLQVKYSHIFLF